MSDEQTPWSPQQLEAIRKVKDWYHEDRGQVFRLFGYAGVGKTTLARHIVDELGLTGQALYAAYTGKAAHVLRSKGCDGANTIHSLIYMPIDKIRKKLQELEEQLEQEADPLKRAILERKIQVEKENLRNPEFILKEDSELSGAPLLVLDEVSMVNRTMATDLLSFGAKLLVLGDPAQLPPVEGGGYFINHRPDHLLTEIHRSAWDSPVTRVATAVRQSHLSDRLFGIAGADGVSGRRKLNGGELLDFDQVIVGTNRTRWQFINVLRSLRGLTRVVPQPDDKIIVLANNKTHRVFNGQQLTVTECAPNKDYPDVLHVEAIDDENKERTLPVLASGFVDLEGEKEAKLNGRNRLVAATFSQAITCHKSQGSQWDKVMIIDESSVFRRPDRRDIAELGPEKAAERAHGNARSWMYTAITRAVDQAVILDI